MQGRPPVFVLGGWQSALLDKLDGLHGGDENYQGCSAPGWSGSLTSKRRPLALAQVSNSFRSASCLCCMIITRSDQSKQSKAMQYTHLIHEIVHSIDWALKPQFAQIDPHLGSARIQIKSDLLESSIG